MNAKLAELTAEELTQVSGGEDAPTRPKKKRPPRMGAADTEPVPPFSGA